MRLDDLLALPRRKSLLDCFWDKTIPEPNSGCLLWTGCVDKDGYGFIRIDGKNIKAHRLSYVLAHGELEDFLDALHTCDTPSCVESRHLFKGTNSDNQKDAVRKGRASAERNLPSTKGDLHPQSKVSRGMVAEIRKLKAEGYTVAGLAGQFNIGRCTVWRIVTGRYWC